MPQCNLLGIDYCSIHLWPDNWNTFDTKFPTTWITAHESATKTLNKPLVLEEVRAALSSYNSHPVLEACNAWLPEVRMLVPCTRQRSAYCLDLTEQHRDRLLLQSLEVCACEWQATYHFIGRCRSCAADVA